MNTNPSGGLGILRRRGSLLVVIKPNGEKVEMGLCMPGMERHILDESVPETCIERIEREVHEHRQRMLNALQGGPYELD
jgi:hypothetical protein